MNSHLINEEHYLILAYYKKIEIIKLSFNSSGYINIYSN